MPTVVLVNGASASASEVLAGALQDYGVARVVGEQTFGKGVGQLTFNFNDGSSLRLVTFAWRTPNGRSIHKTGIKPDEIVKMTPEDREQKKDPQLDRAISILTGK
jgi:carboxyl-terminal processing protease